MWSTKNFIYHQSMASYISPEKFFNMPINIEEPDVMEAVAGPRGSGRWKIDFRVHSILVNIFMFIPPGGKGIFFRTRRVVVV